MKISTRYEWFEETCGSKEVKSLLKHFSVYIDFPRKSNGPLSCFWWAMLISLGTSYWVCFADPEKETGSSLWPSFGHWYLSASHMTRQTLQGTPKCVLQRCHCCLLLILMFIRNLWLGGGGILSPGGRTQPFRKDSSGSDHRGNPVNKYTQTCRFSLMSGPVWRYYLTAEYTSAYARILREKLGLQHTGLHHALLNTLRPSRNGRHFSDDIFKRILFNENVWISIKISLKFVPKGPINNIPALV